MGTSRARTHVVFAAIAATMVVAHALLPRGPAGSVLYVTVELGTATAALAGLRRHRPDHTAPWWLLAAALGSSGLTSAAWYGLAAVGRDPTVVSPIYLLSFVCALAAVCSIIRARSPRAGFAALLDTAIVTTGLGVLLWVFVVQPAWQAAGAMATPRLLIATYPVFALAMLAGLARLAFGGGPRVVSFRWLVTGVAVYLAVLVAEILPGLPVDIATLDTMRLVSTAAFGVAALHPSMREVTARTAPDTARFGGTRLATLWTTSVAAPVTLLVKLGSGEDGVVAVIAVGSIVLFTLVVARMWGLLGTLRDVLQRRHEDRFRALVEHAEEVIYIIHPERGLTYASPSAWHVWGYRMEELQTLGPGVVVPVDRPRMLAALASAAAAPPGGVIHFEGRGLHADGSTRHVAATLANHLDDPAIEGVVATCRDVTEQRELDEQLTHQAFHDPLTGLPNRALFADRAAQALEGREEELFTAVLFLDLDDFKTINDGLGHDTGDELLRVVARRLADAVRPEDTVARFGGDEFAVLLTRVADMDHVTDLAARLLGAVAEPVELQRRRIEPSASLGIATSHDEATAEALLRDADAAMYVAKHAGKGGFRLFDPKMHARALRRLQLTNDLREAGGRGELSPVYQTLHAVSSDDVVGIEALLRWSHPVHGPVRPDEFIPLAEESGSIHEIGALVLDHACDDIVRYRAATGRDLFLTVNVSAVQLTDPSLVEVVRAALERTGLPPRALVLELTESVFIADDDAVTATLDALGRLGVRLAIDDFGTGYCSLAYLDRIRVDIVKVDRSFVTTLDEPRSDSRLTAGIFDLIATLGVPAVAEGVETVSQHEALRQLGVAYGQGWLWSHPVPAEELLHRAEVPARA